MSRLEELERRLLAEPNNLGLRVTVAGARREAGRPADAVELYRSVAIAYSDQGRIPQAVAVCQSILEIAPADARCQGLLAALVAQAREASSPVTQDETPLPGPLPYHVADPTRQGPHELVAADIAELEPDAATEDGTLPGVHHARGNARRISAWPTHRDPHDPAAEPETEERMLSGGDAVGSRPRDRVGVSLADEDLVTSVPEATLKMRARPRQAPEVADEDDDDGIPTISDEEADEPTQRRDLPLEVMLRAEAEGPLASPFFQPLPESHRGAVLMRFHRKVVKAGTTVIRQGETGHALVLVERGQLEVRITRSSGAALQLAPIAAGDYIGEAALLLRTPAPAQVVAATDCALLLLAARDLFEIAGAFPALWAELKHVAERRTRELEARLRR